ncbi:MAG: AMP-binding protein [Burkholderiaceae bacterium]
MIASLAYPAAADAGAPVAVRDRDPISAGQMVADMRAVARMLPRARHLINACRDRYRFAVVMGAAGLRGQVCVLPHNHVPDTVRLLGERFGPLPCVHDGEQAFAGLPGVAYPADLPAASEWPAPRFDAAQMAACLFTSGSTGVPQAYLRDWGTLLGSARAAAASLGIAADRRWQVLATVPSQHSYGFESAIFLPLVAQGVLDCGHPFYPADVLSALARLARPRLLVTTPVHLRSLVQAGLAPVAADLVLSATAPLSPALALEAERFFAGPVHEIYGATECGQVATRRPLEDERWTPLPDLQFEARDADFFVHGGHVGAPVALSDLLDIGADGHFRLLGRKADLVLVAGKRSSRVFLEAQILAVPGVREAAVLTRGDDQVGTRVAAFVVAPGLTRESLMAQLRSRIEPAFLPRPLHLVGQLPRDGNGKVTMATLERLLAAGDTR